MYTDQQKIDLLTQELKRSTETMKFVLLNTLVSKEAYEYLELRIITNEAELNNIIEDGKLTILKSRTGIKSHSITHTALPDGEPILWPYGMPVESRVNNEPTLSIADRIELLKQKLLTA